MCHTKHLQHHIEEAEMPGGEGCTPVYPPPRVYLAKRLPQLTEEVRGERGRGGKGGRGGRGGSQRKGGKRGRRNNTAGIGERREGVGIGRGGREWRASCGV